MFVSGAVIAPYGFLVGMVVVGGGLFEFFVYGVWRAFGDTEAVFIFDGVFDFFDGFADYEVIC